MILIFIKTIFYIYKFINDIIIIIVIFYIKRRKKTYYYYKTIEKKKDYKINIINLKKKKEKSLKYFIH